MALTKDEVQIKRRFRKTQRRFAPAAHLDSLAGGIAEDWVLPLCEDGEALLATISDQRAEIERLEESLGKYKEAWRHR